MFTPEEETAIRDLLGAVADAGQTRITLASTLKVGKLTTAISAIEAQVQNFVRAMDENNQRVNGEIESLAAKKAALQADLRALQGG